VESGDCIKILNLHKDFCQHCKNSNDCVVSVSVDKTIMLTNYVNSVECLRTFISHLNTVNCVKILSNERIMSGSVDQTVKIWKTQTSAFLQTLNGHKNTLKFCVKRK